MNVPPDFDELRKHLRDALREHRITIFRRESTGGGKEEKKRAHRKIRQSGQ
jgi:hypothetical protein